MADSWDGFSCSLALRTSCKLTTPSKSSYPPASIKKECHVSDKLSWHGRYLDVKSPHLRQLYQTCILPVISYALVVWWTGKKQHAQAISKVQNRVIWLICAAFCTTPIHALEIEASIPPIPLFPANKHTAKQFNKLSTDNPILQRLPQE